ncbi:MAG TPA: S9 family peptidase [Balneolaceae bacterium]|nr:S9 family peptidase [Balneolaceae bacterium]|tara:strand:+ start:157510 stop:160275 length:2766 start_codon:yes stop_codon:yes gene_type:complete
MKLISKGILLTLLSLMTVSQAFAQGVLTFEDVMKFEDIDAPQISSKGNWLAYGVWPDRGDGYVLVQPVNGGREYKIDLGQDPIISADENWVAAYKKVPLKVQIDEKKDGPKQGMVLLSLKYGSQKVLENVRSFEFSNNGKWLAINKYQEESVEKMKSGNKLIGTELILIDLVTREETSFPFVHSMEFDSLSNYMAYSIVDSSGTENGLYVYDLKTEVSQLVDRRVNGYYANLTWEPKRSDLAFTFATYDTTFIQSDAWLRLWSPKKAELKTLVSPEEIDPEYALRSRNRLTFTHDGERLFFGLMLREMVDLDMKKEEESSEKTTDIYDVESITGDREMDLWHGEDPLIKPNEINTWNGRKNHLFTSVFHFKGLGFLGRKPGMVQLADKAMPEIEISHNSNVVLGSSGLPYQKEITWDGRYNDYYIVDLKSGERTMFLERSGENAELSPTGKHVIYYTDKQWHLYNVKKKETINLTESIDVPFFNEDHDYPYPVPGYGIAGWTKKDNEVLIYDKFDVWRFSVDGKEALNITAGEGRRDRRIFRIRKLKDRGIAFENGQDLLLSSYHDEKKNFGFFTTKLNEAEVYPLIEDEKKFTFIKKVEDGSSILFKRESYDEFPNLWVSENWKFRYIKQVSHLHEDLHEKWNWGTAELIDWLSVDGKKIQGVVIKPDNYDPDKRYPILTYYYRFFTDRLYDFNEPKTNHRPVFAQYVSDDYVVFLPDIRFEVGRPGFAATKSLVPGIQKLVEMGIADEDRLGLHGHSWSGYQTAFIVTQTDIFDAAVTGAPVSNMTSAYGGIRWGSGLARQFQYEQTQSRIGVSIAEDPLRYIENSPVFYADRINTPMLIQHGDDDGAVPWYQSIELYLAMRRYGKDVIFLQYHGEPHHLQKFPNKLDYAIRMKEYFDYYLKGEGEPEWILKGEAYRGK